MLWLIVEEKSLEIIACNTAFQDGKHQVWVERPNGKTMKIHESTNKEEALEVREAIDFAIEHGHKTLKL